MCGSDAIDKKYNTFLSVSPHINSLHYRICVEGKPCSEAYQYIDYNLTANYKPFLVIVKFSWKSVENQMIFVWKQPPNMKLS